ncbi:uncharacterized protein LOC118403535 [Branchiostoma floridae]|uniref:Uncharacterized protein LOC118403535 n=1 Tax=Branchiostoma floridae TaxID=7739 RepID=A0A9J7K5Y9_BRAFL|nr:uncharacterized protein LOC118403535 [Branchiostoma floridae]
MASIIVEEGEMFVSHDVVSLFTNTPVPETLNIIKDRLLADTDLKNRTKLQVEDIMELLTFIVTTTYFSFRGNIYQQRFGTAMGSPVSPVLANLFMEWLEQQAMATAPVNCRPKLWKRYVDDIMEIIRQGTQHELTDHLNSIDPTGSIKFTQTRSKTVVTEETDRQQEVKHIKQALSLCGYPDWTFKRVQHQSNKPKPKKEKKKEEQKSKGMIIIPYVKGITETLERIFRKHAIATAVKPKTTLRNLLVHPKDRLEDSSKTDCVYKIPCKSCDKVYIGETGRTFNTRLEEHKKEAQNSKGIGTLEQLFAHPDILEHLFEEAEQF